MLMYVCLPRLFYLGLRSGLSTGNFGQSPQSWVYVTVDKEDNKALYLNFLSLRSVAAGEFNRQLA
jgi:hypothetical protein